MYIGSFGRVLLAKQKKTGDYFAMKRLTKNDIIKLRQVDHVFSENTILSQIDHPLLVSQPSISIFLDKFEISFISLIFVCRSDYKVLLKIIVTSTF